MSDLKPPSQTSPGPAPSSRRTATDRSLDPVPKVKKFRQECVIAGPWGPDGRAGLSGRRGNDSAGSRSVTRGVAPDRVSPQCATQCKGRRMAVMDAAAPKAVRGLPGATVLHVLPALAETEGARAAVDTAVALLRSGARVIVAAEDGPVNGELQGLGAEWVGLVTQTGNPIARSRNAATRAHSG